MDGIEPQRLGKFLDGEGIAVRSSHHCAQPALAHYGLAETVRPSLAFYNTHEEIDALVAALNKARRELGR
jgi:cysteine desulfurase/selenocysteine lyase